MCDRMRIFRRTRCKIVYRSEYFTGFQTRNSRQSFDIMRFNKVRNRLIKERSIRRKDVLTAQPLSWEDMLLVHTRSYLESLKNPMKVGEILNLDYVNPWDEYIFEYFRYVAGGTLKAAEFALEKNLTVFNLGGGFHHAHPDRGEGFCLINDVAIAVRKLKQQNRIGKTLIIDLDYHQGNGTLLYFEKDESVFTFSMHAENWAETLRKVNNLDIELPGHIKDAEYLKILKNETRRIFSIFQPDLVFYLAGSDPYIRDTLGDFDLSEEGMLERDVFVYRQVRERRIPLIVLGAGGYGPESWKIYFNFIQWAIRKGRKMC